MAEKCNNKFHSIVDCELDFDRCETIAHVFTQDAWCWRMWQQCTKNKCHSTNGLCIEL